MQSHLLTRIPTGKPATWHTQHAAGNLRYAITAADLENAAGQPPNPRLRLSKINTLVCPVVENPPVHQCGQTFESQPDFRRHLRQVHSGCFVNHNMERLARDEDDFRNAYGERFHRLQQPVTPTSGGRSRRRGQNPPPNPIPFVLQGHDNGNHNNNGGNRDSDGDGDGDGSVSSSSAAFSTGRP
ncbi:uncharacterized protein N7446_010837 [Penicillium canescens]|uniref:C2H2-type domain-containing protein n=1 Tax=Penicillium canescens TaxID=5083 RepID=A0AAD6IAY9_PENCN|nr:uncharacterized protein N7446_010837 [Penicillium canescens]KAJ6041274.1 hypothetical protein N7460_006664 [Penicillium canescens]KAJ6050728.1 hypothetical protein N7446_010837 [Penicillium canescens]